MRDAASGAQRCDSAESARRVQMSCVMVFDREQRIYSLMRERRA
jgi:hypothetical protein